MLVLEELKLTVNSVAYNALCWEDTLYSTTWTFAGKVAQRAAGNPGDSWKDILSSRVIDSPTRGDALLDLMVTDASELISDIKTGGSLGCSDHA